MNSESLFTKKHNKGVLSGDGIASSSQEREAASPGPLWDFSCWGCEGEREPLGCRCGKALGRCLLCSLLTGPCGVAGSRKEGQNQENEP